MADELEHSKHNIRRDPWTSLKAFTNARIALGSAGAAVPVQEVLQFKMAHAHARDAVHSLLDMDVLASQLQTLALPYLSVHSKATDRTNYLQRPDYGRQLNDASVGLLQQHAGSYDIAIILADGLSATAINHNAIALLQGLIPALQKNNFTISPIIIAQQARVALADEISQLLYARLSIILIGERPGLSSPASMGAYITFQPSVGLTDERRNCISNIHGEGLPIDKAVGKIMYIIGEAFRLQISGVALKELSFSSGGAACQ